MAKSPELEHPVKSFGWAAKDISGLLSPFKFSRRATGEHDVQFQVLYCGICHTDLHMIKNDWGITNYPVVPGHETVGVVTEVGSKVQKFKVGDKVGVGPLLKSCGKCNMCATDLENYCPKQILAYNTTYLDGTNTYGGYSNLMVVHEQCVLQWPDNLPLHAAPLVCAGITAYSPLRYFGLDKPGTHVGVVGLGGLGHLVVKFAKFFGARITVISTSAPKQPEAIEKLGADAFLLSTDSDQMQDAVSTMDAVIDTISAFHPIAPFIDLLVPHGKLIVVGAPEKPLELPIYNLSMGRKIVTSSSIGGLKESQEMLEFAANHNILPDVEVIPIDLERLAKGDVKYRFVIDIGNTIKSAYT